MAYTRPAVAVLRMTRVEPQIQSKGLVLGLLTNEVDSSVDYQFGFMPQGSIRKLFVKGVATNCLEDIKVFFGGVALGHFRMPLTKVASPVSLLSK